MQPRCRSLFLLGCALAICVSLFAAAKPLPTQLDDREYRRIVTEFSEEGGSFTAENFVSNEPNFQQVLTRLQSAAKPGGAYIGVGPEQNFTYIVALQPSIAFIVDIRRQNLIQHLIYKAAFEMSANRGEFLSILFSCKKPAGVSDRSTLEEMISFYKSAKSDPDLAKNNLKAIQDVLTKRHGFALSSEDLQTLEHVLHIFELYGPLTGYSSNLNTVDFTNGGGHNGNFSTILMTTDDQGVNRSFLATEENFRVIKSMEQRNLIVPLVGDFGGKKTIRAIGQYLIDHQATVAAFYVSNVEQYLFQKNPTAVNGGAQNFYDSVGMLPLDASSTFIRSSNTADVKQPYVGFTSLLGSMQETIQVFKQNGFKTLRDVFALSH